jgi:hypothetical protein
LVHCEFCGVGPHKPDVLHAAYEYVPARTVISVWPPHFDFHAAPLACIPYIVTLDAVSVDVPLALTLVGAQGMAADNIAVNYAQSTLTGCLTCADCKGGSFRAAIAIGSHFAIPVAETLDTFVRVSTDGAQSSAYCRDVMKPHYTFWAPILKASAVNTIFICVWVDSFKFRPRSGLERIFQFLELPPLVFVRLVSYFKGDYCYISDLSIKCEIAMKDPAGAQHQTPPRR